MKILDVTHFYSRRGGGIKTYIDNKIDYFSRFDDIHHTLLIPDEEDRVFFKKKTKVITIKSPQLLFSKNYRLIINPLKLAKIIEEENPDVVEIGSPFLIPSVVKYIQEKKGFKIVGFFHSDLEKVSDNVIKKGNLIKPLVKKYVHKTYNDMDCVIAPSNYIQNYLKKIGVSKVEVVYHGIDVGRFTNSQIDRSLRNFYGIPENKIVLIYAGRFSPDKNFSELLRIFKTLNYLKPNVYHLLLVGDGNLKEEIYDTLDSDYTVLDYINDKDELIRIYKVSNIFVSASKSDTFGISLIEAQACGLPVVAYSENSFPEIVYYKNFLAKDSLDFAYKIITLSQNLPYIDREKMISFVKDNFDLNITMSKLIKVYEKVLSI